ncbi:hypothetical protein [Paenibacillus marinisediminis]
MNISKKLVFILISLLSISVIAALIQFNNKKATLFSELLNDAMRGTEIVSININEYKIVEPFHDHHLFETDKEKIKVIYDMLADLRIKEDPDAKTNIKRTAYNIAFSNSDRLMFAIVITDGGSLDSYDYVKGKSAVEYRILSEFDYDKIERLFDQVNE